ncbi:MAG: protein kinase family protein [Colwellia sp.]|nr:protein kinase family protein [Colwellia sp.]
MKETNAAHDLKGKVLQTGWKVVEKIIRPDHATGSFFSVCYKVTKEDDVCFLKAFDFAKFFQIADPSKMVVDVMGDMVNAYRYERDLSNLCKNNHVTKVSFVKGAGEENVNGYSISTVPYLVFDLADGDVRSKLDISEKLDFAWRLQSLHDIAVGLKQLHYIEVSHQDLKPSNILLFNEESKIGDLGRSICKNFKSPHDNSPFTGDYSYAPPEIMYGYFEQNWHKRVFAADCYLLGSMVVFYFTGISMSALLLQYIPKQFKWDNWRGPYESIKPYIADAFSKALDTFEEELTSKTFKDELRWVVEKLCNPFPEKRGHPENIASLGSSYKLERFISKFDLLHKKARYNLIH